MSRDGVDRTASASDEETREEERTFTGRPARPEWLPRERWPRDEDEPEQTVSEWDPFNRD